VASKPVGRRKRRPAQTDKGREDQLISLAVNLAEKQMMEGTASSQVITHYLKLGSSREKLEQARLAGENELLKAKIESMASAKRVEELYTQALEAMKTYAGQEVSQEEFYER
jgi:hypothetical protein